MELEVLLLMVNNWALSWDRISPALKHSDQKKKKKKKSKNVNLDEKGYHIVKKVKQCKFRWQKLVTN